MSAPGTALHSFAFPKGEILRLCFLYGRILQPHLVGCIDRFDAPIDGPRLLWALAGNESSFGANCTPRYEPAYGPDGIYYRQSPQQRELWRIFGRDAACSFTAWQVMLCNAPGFKPEELGTDAEKGAIAAIGYIRRYVLGAKNAKKLEDIFDTYNSGTWRDEVTPAVRNYIRDGLRRYENEVIAE